MKAKKESRRRHRYSNAIIDLETTTRMPSKMFPEKYETWSPKRVRLQKVKKG